MLTADILHSCSDEGIAAAAVASIGGPFAAAIRAEAMRSGLTIGALTASLVSSFARDASERDWRELSAAMAGADHPVLSGLQTMAERALRHAERATRLRPERETAAPLRPGAPMSPAMFRCTA